MIKKYKNYKISVHIPLYVDPKKKKLIQKHYKIKNKNIAPNKILRSLECLRQLYDMIDVRIPKVVI